MDDSGMALLIHAVLKLGEWALVMGLVFGAVIAVGVALVALGVTGIVTRRRSGRNEVAE